MRGFAFQYPVGRMHNVQPAINGRSCYCSAGLPTWGGDTVNIAVHGQPDMTMRFILDKSGKLISRLLVLLNYKIKPLIKWQRINSTPDRRLFYHSDGDGALPSSANTMFQARWKVQMASPMSRGLPSRNLLRRRVGLQTVRTVKISTFVCRVAISCLRMSI